MERFDEELQRLERRLENLEGDGYAERLEEKVDRLEKLGGDIAEKLQERVKDLERRGSEIAKRLEERIERLENGGKQKERRQGLNGKHCTINPDDMEVGRFAFVGRYQSDDGTFGSTFGDDSLAIKSVLRGNSFEMAKVIDAFSSEERINIVKELMKERLSARTLMERLNFATTGKLYHHLSFLEKVGVIMKQDDLYFISPKYISSIVLIFTGADKIIRKNNED